MKKIVLPSLIALLLAACEQTPPLTDILVAEGWMEEGRHPVVFLHKAVRLDGNETEMEGMMRQSIVYSARVFVSDGTDTIQLIAKIDTAKMPPYYYHNVRMTGQAGKTYTLTVDYRGQTLTSTTTIPPTVPIDSIVISASEHRPEAREVNIHFRDNPATTDYYALFYCKGRQTQYTLSSLGVRDDLSWQGRHVVWRLNRSHTLLDNEDDFGFAVGDTVSVRLSHIDAASYAFWSSFASASMTNTWIFMSKTQISSNINGGLGCWCGYGSDIRKLIIPAADTAFVYTVGSDSPSGLYGRVNIRE